MSTPVPIVGNYLTYHLVERGTIMLFTIGCLAMLVNVIIQFIKGTLDKNLLEQSHVKYQVGTRQRKQAAPSGDNLVKEGRESRISVNKIGMVMYSQSKSSQQKLESKVSQIRHNQEEEVTFIDTCAKTFNNFNHLFAIFVLWLLTLITGTNYPFAITLFFIVLAFMILFNVLKLHRKFCQVYFLWALFESLYLIASFFWCLNIWTIQHRIWQPYFLVQVLA